MIYSKYFFPQSPKIPTPVTIGVVFLIIFFLARLFGLTPLRSRGSKKIVRQLRLVNPSHNQVGMFWQTDEKETGWLIYGYSELGLNKVALDERDLQDKRNLFYNHLVVLKNLEPDTRYFYKIVSNNQLGKAFSFKTPLNLSFASNLSPAYGKIIRENGDPLKDAVVILFFDQAYPLATLSKTTGEWLLPLNSILNKDTMKTQSVDSKDKLTLEIFGEEKKKTQIIADVSHISPLPQTVIFGKNYKFLSTGNVLSTSTESKTQISKIEILFPKEDAVIPVGTPLIKGTAIPGSEIAVTIDSAKSYSFKTVTDKDGVWRILLTEQLPPGSHVLKMVTKDANGKNVELTRKFIIAKSGEQVLAAATEEATPTFTPTTTPSPSLTPTISISLTPTVSLTPLVPGTNFIPIGAASASLIILGLGILLAF